MPSSCMQSPIVGDFLLGFSTDGGLTVYFVVVDAYLRLYSGESATSAGAETLPPHFVWYDSIQQTSWLCLVPVCAQLLVEFSQNSQNSRHKHRL